MKFGLLFANTLGFATPQGAADMGRAAEAAGFESAWTVEHVVYPDDYTSTSPTTLPERWRWHRTPRCRIR